MKTTIAFVLVQLMNAIILAMLLSGCSVDTAGLAAVDTAAIRPPSAHPDADAPAEPAPDAAVSEVAAIETGADLPSESSRGSLLSCALAATPAACSSCRAGSTDLAALCSAALACLTTSPPYEVTPVAGQPPDPIGYCTSSQPVAACIRAICP